MANEKVKRGFLAKHANYRDWFLSQSDEWKIEHMPICERCGRAFIPDAPNQKYCSDNCFKKTHETCFYDGSWVKKMDKIYVTPIKQR